MSVSSTNQSNPIHTKESSLEHIHKISTSLLHQSRISDEIDTACCESISKTQHVEKILDNLQAMQWQLSGIEHLLSAIHEDVAKYIKIHDTHRISYLDKKTISCHEWLFDGKNMITETKEKFPVPRNYASKSKLVPWDTLKLRILENGDLVYKLVDAVARKILKATLSKNDDNLFVAITNTWSYFLNEAAISYFHWKVWDEVFIHINKRAVHKFAAVETIIKK